MNRLEYMMRLAELLQDVPEEERVTAMQYYNDYFNIDPTLIRLGWVLVALTGSGLIAYFAAAIIIPDEPAAY